MEYVVMLCGVLRNPYFIGEHISIQGQCDHAERQLAAGFDTVDEEPIGCGRICREIRRELLRPVIQRGLEIEYHRRAFRGREMCLEMPPRFVPSFSILNSYALSQAPDCQGPLIMHSSSRSSQFGQLLT